MRKIIQQAHVYLSLLSFTGLVVFGLVGLHATVSPAWEERGPGSVTPREVNYAFPKDIDDAALSERIRREFISPLATAIAPQFLQHDSSGRLVMTFYDVNGATKVIADEARGILHLEQSRVNTLEYLNRIHATTTGTPSRDWRVRAWVWYNEFAVWAILGMTATGVLLWLISRPRHLGAAIAATGGASVFGVLYWVLR